MIVPTILVYESQQIIITGINDPIQ